jgi:hypothetical protein
MTEVQDKVQYVKAQKNSGDHTCHWPGCTTLVPPAMWGCKKHWLKLPWRLRKMIWAAYRPGQEITKTPSKEYLDVADEVQSWIRSGLDRKDLQG